MTTQIDNQTFEAQALVVAFPDLTGFWRFSRARPAPAVVSTLAAYYELVGDLVEEAGGKVVKFMGDAGLLIYPVAAAERAVVGLQRLQAVGDAWLTDHDTPCRHIIKAHVGPVYCGQVGTRTEKHFDVFGETVITAAMLPSHGLAITPSLFRQLGPSTRKLFKKHTPPVTYIPLEERHQD
jgi:adenylate cyclase